MTEWVGLEKAEVLAMASATTWPLGFHKAIEDRLQELNSGRGLYQHPICFGSYLGGHVKIERCCDDCEYLFRCTTASAGNV